ncbi:MAG: hypothetical protein ACRDY6_04295 [Acidimicrobiia bacterium]
METAQKILVVYGTLSLSFGFALGIALTSVRMRRPEASRHLTVAHLSAIIQGAVHLGLSVALGFAEITAWLETAAALLLVTGSALFVLGATLNWLQHIGDHFAERSLGWRLLAASGPAHISGIAIVTAGVLVAV